jgi:hypothetical protein
MPNRIGSIIPMGFTALYAMLATTVLADGSARAADDCLGAPNSEPPQGSHWYYRIDGAKQRHCWYLGPEGQKVHNAGPEVRPAAKSIAPPRTETAGDRLMASAQIEPPWPPLRPATAAGATPPVVVQGIPQAAREETSSVVQWPDPHRSAGASDHEAGGPSTLQDVSAEDEVARPAVVSAANAKTNMLIRVILLVAGALAAAGIFQRTIFGIVVARRRIRVERGRVEPSVSVAREQMPRGFAASCPNGLKRTPVEQIDPLDIEEGFRQILRAVERRAA